MSDISFLTSRTASVTRFDQGGGPRPDAAKTGGTSDPAVARPKVICRQMTEADRSGVAALLTRGFPERARSYWDHALDVLAERRIPLDCPRFGFVLTAQDRIAGVVLLIFSEALEAGAPLRCFVSSWYVEDEFRVYASWLISRALKQKQALYLNMSSAAHTRDTITAQGFSRYADGVYFALAALARGNGDALVHRVREDGLVPGTSGMPEPFQTLLMDHARSGCISLAVRAGGVTYPFIFLRRRIPKTFLPCAQLIYCGDLSHFIRFAGPIGRYLLRNGLFIVMADAKGPLAGLPGRFYAGRLPKYFRGAAAPALGDLTYSEAVLFGP